MDLPYLPPELTAAAVSLALIAASAFVLYALHRIERAVTLP
jgi:hypothetical protein